MKRLLLIVLAVLSVAAQETTLPQDHYCMNHAPPKNEVRAHECHCQYFCHLDEHGNAIESESHDCKVYCHRERCTCHPEEPCPSPKG